MRAVSVLVLLGVSFILSCQDDNRPCSHSKRMSEIEAKIEEGQRKLDLLQSELREQAKQLETAKVELAYQECRVTVASLRAETERRRSECARELAQHHVCEANNAKQSGEKGVLGCLLGIAAAAASGGAATPWALGGCGAGLLAGEAAAVTCPMPDCVADVEAVELTVLKEHSMSAMPTCGGSVGVTVETAQKTVSGVRIDKVGPGTSAATAGLAPGDVLLAINGRVTPHPNYLPALLATIEPGSRLRLTTYRKGQKFVLKTRASTRAYDGTTSDKVALGVYHAQEAVRVQVQVGARVTLVPAGAPATGHLRVGDVVRALSHPDSSNPTWVVPNAKEFLDAQDDFRAGQEVRFDIVDAGGVKRSELVTMGPGGSPAAVEKHPSKATQP